tara:strand:- start:6747 stop:9104 length:2358 start_codon:yes stop_codon:yes gene_type:complete
MSEATQLIKSSIPNAFAIENTRGADVFMSLKNSENQLDIRLKNSDFIFSTKKENTKLLYSNIDFAVDEIAVNKIIKNEFSNITIEGDVNIINGNLTHHNLSVLVLNSDNKIPTSYINDANYLTIQNTQSNIYIPNSVVMINTSNMSNDAVITIKNNATNSEEVTVKLVDSYDRGTIKIYSQDPYVAIGYNSPIKTNNLQLYVESNIKCNDIIVNDNSFIDFYNDYTDYKSNNDMTGVNIKTNKLYYYDNKILLEPDIKHFRTIDDFIFNATSFFNITNILCSANNTYIIAENTLYRLIPDNKYQYIDSDIKNIKSENGIIIYTKLNNVYFIYNDYTINIENNYKTGGYFDNVKYLANDTQIIKKTKDDDFNTEIILNIPNITDISVINADNIYIKQNADIYQYNIPTYTSNLINTDVSSYYLGFNSSLYYDSNISVSSISSNVYKLMNNNLYTENDILLESNVLKVHHSDRHIVLLKDDNKIYTKAFDNSYIGLGRSAFSILDNTLDKFVGLGIQTKDIMIIKNSVNIGGSLDVFKNEVPNSLCVENCIGIACKPLNDFALRLKGNILIEGGNIYRTSDMQTLYESNVTPLTLDDYVKYEDFDIRVDGIASNIESILMCNLNVNKNNIDKLIYDAENAINLWVKESNIVTVKNTRVSINPSDNDDYSVLGGSKQPALFIGNYSSNIKGLICEDDIAAYSDESLKTDIKPISDALNKVLQLNGVNYRRKDNIDKLCMGVIAQNIETQCPEVVYEHNNIKTVAYQNLVALLIEAVKDLYTIIKDEHK